MSDAALLELADRAGVAARWQDYRGQQREVAPHNLRRVLAALELPCETPQQTADSLARLRAEDAQPRLPPLLTARIDQGATGPAADLVPGRLLRLRLESGGLLDLMPVDAGDGRATLPPVAQPGYHRLELADRELTLAVAPGRCLGVDDLAPGRRLWGLSVQLYALRRTGDGGIGDFRSLSLLAQLAAQQGADALALSPVHAQFSADVHRYGPYAPSSRLFYNPMHADAAAALGAARLQDLATGLRIGDDLAVLEAAPLIDWPRAQALRLRLLRAAWTQLLQRELAPGSTDPLAAQLHAWRAAGGAALEAHARFEALHAAQFAQGRWHWRDWPPPLRDPADAAVAAFAERQADEVGFHVFLQWLAAHGLAGAQHSARAAGMAIGLIGDLAVGTDGGGSHAWMRQADMLTGLTVGAPPDAISTQGQGWGLSAFSPRALRRSGFGAFLEMLRASLRHVGGLRIDHVLGLQRLWLIPDGGSAADGAYVRYPQEDLLRLIALESWRSRALIVGEDLGTVPDGFRDTLQGAGILGMRVLWFERDHGYFIEPSRWSAEAMATTTTHDLPTAAGWWQGCDIDAREQAGQGTAADAARERVERELDRRMLWGAFEYAEVARGAAPPASNGAAIVDPALRFVARTPCKLAMIPLEDLAGLDQQPNLPGTLDEHPNWRRRLPRPAEDLLGEATAQARLALLRQERGPS